VVTGVVGVFLGTYISRKLRDRFPNADPLICAFGMLSSSPCFFIAIILAGTSIPATYVSKAQTLFCIWLDYFVIQCKGIVLKPV